MGAFAKASATPGSRARQLRVAVVARAAAPLHGVGGLERSVQDLVRHLAKKGVAVTLITPPPKPRAAEAATAFAAETGITMAPVPYRTFPGANRRGTTVLDRSTAYLLFGQRAGRAAGRLAASGAVDIVHGFGASVLGYARQSSRPAPLVLNPQGLEEFGATASGAQRSQGPSGPGYLKRLGYAPLRAAVRRCARVADCIIATDRSLEDTVRHHLRPKPGQMRTIPNGIDLEAARALANRGDGERLRGNHGIGRDDWLFVSAGRIERNKGFDVLAAALGQIAVTGGPLHRLPWRWAIVGAGPAETSLRTAVKEAGIESHVIWAGRATDAELHAWYEAATLFVHPTRYEGSSLVTLEAMAHRKPIIATRAGGLPDKVKPGENGWLVDPDDPTALAGAIRSAIEAPGRFRDMGIHSLEIVERDFAWTRIVEMQLAVYEELLQRG